MEWFREEMGASHNAKVCCDPAQVDTTGHRKERNYRGIKRFPPGKSEDKYSAEKTDAAGDYKCC